MRGAVALRIPRLSSSETKRIACLAFLEVIERFGHVHCDECVGESVAIAAGSDLISSVQVFRHPFFEPKLA